MALSETFRDFVLDQLSQLGRFETKNMFGGVALLHEGKAFAKIKHDKVWLKVDDSNREDFESLGMKQYTYGKDGGRKLNFYETPVDVLEDADELVAWARESMRVAAKAA
jgi:DNA transformation protein